MPNYPHGCTYSGYGGLFRRESRDGVSIFRAYIYPTKSVGRVRRLANYFSFALSSLVVGAAVLPRLDCLLTESPPLFLGISGFFLSRLKRARWIFNVSDLWPESAVRLGMLGPGSLAFRLSAGLEAFCYQHAWLVTGQSKSILSSIVDRFPGCPTFHFSNGVDSLRFGPEQETETARLTLTNNRGCVALYAGLHGVAQGLDQVLCTAEALRPEGSFRFVLVGDGPEKKRLLEEAAKRGLTNVRFLDSRPAPEIPALLAAADVVLVPLKSYLPGAVPSKLYEAMASGRPVVLVATGEAAEIVREHQAGMTVEPGRVEDLTHALRTLGAEPQLRRTLGENGRRAAEQHFDRTKIVSRFLEHLEAHLHP
jgi:glycosyltransferase involved in cell wall biosynthesis